MTEDQIQKLVGAWAHSRFDIILNVEDLERVEDAIRWAVDWGWLDPGTGLLSSVEEAP